ncbi:response regulator transcription factor [Paraburkholderia sp. BR10937]|uniref:response regulator transcription factor n=1 Tax=Paraburkholderia sp. BR10937 TaxID=3236994 RepID=UPI0034D248E6
MNDAPDDAIDSIVYVIDDDSAMRKAVETLLGSVGLTVKLFAAATEFFALELPDVPGCVVLDVRLKGQNGLDVQENIVRRLRLPVILMTAHGDIPMSVQAMKAGAVDFLAKPFRGQDMVEAVTSALEVDRLRRLSERSAAALRALYESLTARERKVMELVAGGLLNKQIAAELNLSEITVKLHRGQAMKKMESQSIADFVLKAEALGLVKRPDSPSARA